MAVLEQLSLDDFGAETTAKALLACSSLSEVMIVSTCNRLEVYAMANSFHTGVNDIVEVLHQVSSVPLQTLRSHLYVRYADAAAEHMMLVAAGLESMVVGEQQIIGQVRAAYQRAIDAGTVGPALHGLVQAALHTGKRVHSETDIDDAGASMVSVAFDEALAQLGTTSLRGKRGLVLGAGAMASLAATHLGRLGIDAIVLCNRTRSRAERLAEHARQAGVNAEVVDFERRHEALNSVDIAVSATGAEHYTIAPADIPQSLHGDQLMLIDLSMPRDIADSTAALPGVSLVNIERLHQASRVTPAKRDESAGPESEVAASTVVAERIVAEELDAYTSAQRVRDVAPAVTALRRHASQLIDSELQRLAARTPGMDEQDFEEVQRTVRRVVDKLLHQPTVRVKQLAATSGTVSYESALQELFGLPSEPGGVAVDVAELPDATVVSLNVTEADQVARALG